MAPSPWRREEDVRLTPRTDVSLVSGDVGGRPHRVVPVRETRKEVPGTKIAKQGNSRRSSGVACVHYHLRSN